MEFLSGINTEGIQELIMAFMTLLANFNIKEIDLDMNAQLLTLFAPIWKVRPAFALSSTVKCEEQFSVSAPETPSPKTLE